VEIGKDTFGELVPDPYTHQQISAHERLKNVIRMAIMADEAGLDIFGVGEHHWRRFIGQIDIGGLPFDKVAQTIELLGTEVAPVVRREVARAGQA
jgi:hypothetical protein